MQFLIYCVRILSTSVYNHKIYLIVELDMIISTKKKYKEPFMVKKILYKLLQMIYFINYQIYTVLYIS